MGTMQILDPLTLAGVVGLPLLTHRGEPVDPAILSVVHYPYSSAVTREHQRFERTVYDRLTTHARIVVSIDGCLVAVVHSVHGRYLGPKLAIARAYAALVAGVRPRSRAHHALSLALGVKYRADALEFVWVSLKDARRIVALATAFESLRFVPA